MKNVMEVAGWLIVGSLVVLVITHPNGFSKSVSTVGDETNKIMGTLTGKDQPGQG